MNQDQPEPKEAIRAINRPDPALQRYYIVAALPTVIFPPLFLVFLFLGWVRYSTMRYTFTDEGVSMRWGRMFRREIILNYARIQDIHLRSNLVERWFGLSRILVQTASGSAGAEMTIEGLKEYEAVRDFLYSKMRGVSDSQHPQAARGGGDGAQDAQVGELARILREIAREMERTRLAMEAGRIAARPISEASPHPPGSDPTQGGPVV